jgi:uncharacterized protein YcfJ
MRKSIRNTVLGVVVAALALLSLGGCESNAQTGALVGAAAGAAGGYIIGNEMDKKDHHHHD